MRGFSPPPMLLTTLTWHIYWWESEILVHNAILCIHTSLLSLFSSCRHHVDIRSHMSYDTRKYMWLKCLLSVNIRLSCCFLTYFLFFFLLDSAFCFMLSAGGFSLIIRREETPIRKILVWLNTLAQHVWPRRSWRWCALDSVLFFSHFSLSKQMENEAWLSLVCRRWLDLEEEWVQELLK